MHRSPQRAPKLDESRKSLSIRNNLSSRQKHIINTKDMLTAISDMFARLEGTQGNDLKENIGSPHFVGRLML